MCYFFFPTDEQMGLLSLTPTFEIVDWSPRMIWLKKITFRKYFFCGNSIRLFGISSLLFLVGYWLIDFQMDFFRAFMPALGIFYSATESRIWTWQGRKQLWKGHHHLLLKVHFFSFKKTTAYVKRWRGRFPSFSAELIDHRMSLIMSRKNDTTLAIGGRGH